MPPQQSMHLRGILSVFFRVLLVGFGLFGLGVAKALKKVFFKLVYRGNILAVYIYFCIATFANILLKVAIGS